MDTLFLDPQTWDLVLDANRSIALATKPYALAQDAASEIKTFQGEVYYNTVKGVPYFQEILGFRPPLALMKARMITAALLVPEVIAAQVFFSNVVGRELHGQVQITDSAGVVAAMNF